MHTVGPREESGYPANFMGTYTIRIKLCNVQYKNDLKTNEYESDYGKK